MIFISCQQWLGFEGKAYGKRAQIILIWNEGSVKKKFWKYSSVNLFLITDLCERYLSIVGSEHLRLHKKSGWANMWNKPVISIIPFLCISSFPSGSFFVWFPVCPSLEGMQVIEVKANTPFPACLIVTPLSFTTVMQALNNKLLMV